MNFEENSSGLQVFKNHNYNPFQSSLSLSTAVPPFVFSVLLKLFPPLSAILINFVTQLRFFLEKMFAANRINILSFSSVNWFSY